MVVLTSTERLVETNGVQLRVIDAGDAGAPVVVLAHGFPELAYSWRTTSSSSSLQPYRDAVEGFLCEVLGQARCRSLS